MIKISNARSLKVITSIDKLSDKKVEKKIFTAKSLMNIKTLSQVKIVWLHF